MKKSSEEFVFECLFVGIKLDTTKMNFLADDDLDFLSGMNMSAVSRHLIMSFWGLALNGFIAYVIVAVKELRRQRRYILLLGMIVGNMFIFVGLLSEVAYFFAPGEDTRTVHCIVIGLPYVVFFANYLLLLFDSYMTITSAAWHRSKFTIRKFAIPFQIAFTASACATVKSVMHILMEMPINCSRSFTEINISGAVTMTVLIVPCICLKVAIFKKQRAALRQDSVAVKRSHWMEALIPASTAAQSLILAISVPHFAAIQKGKEDRRQGQQPMGLHMNEQTIAKREKEAVRSLMISVVSLLVIYIPMFIYCIASYIYYHWLMSPPLIIPYDDENNWHRWFLSLAPTIVEFLALHGFIQPLTFLFTCDQFWDAWNNRHLNRI